jgi:hypothetical protein
MAKFLINLVLVATLYIAAWKITGLWWMPWVLMCSAFCTLLPISISVLLAQAEGRLPVNQTVALWAAIVHTTAAVGLIYLFTPGEHALTIAALALAFYSANILGDVMMGFNQAKAEAAVADVRSKMRGL